MFWHVFAMRQNEQNYGKYGKCANMRKHAQKCAKMHKHMQKCAKMRKMRKMLKNAQHAKQIEKFSKILKNAEKMRPPPLTPIRKCGVYCIKTFVQKIGPLN